MSLFFCILTGLYERFLYWCVSKNNFVNETTLMDENLPSLEIIFIVRVLMGFRIYTYSDEAYKYLKPILNGLRLNRTTIDIRSKISFNNKREQALERRSADLIERLAFVIQNIFHILSVLKDLEGIRFNEILG
ncbi:unnamed protein product [Didymodactylos carnosus]|uniref:Uncharacterized protein n=1 Tax=Didymodactylos carnosus TaxID=1234261 RepID=A0A8S2RRB8_9BILA|nr:unnamed protein product [Didymodactylos carnosus]CAF4165337.1 unnamed protein product [Didymodactylos carnosus]